MTERVDRRARHLDEDALVIRRETVVVDRKACSLTGLVNHDYSFADPLDIDGASIVTTNRILVVFYIQVTPSFDVA